MASQETPLVLKALILDDLDTIQTVMKLPHFQNIQDENGNNLLQMSIICDTLRGFDYLLSLDKFYLESPNLNGETPLLLSLHKFRPNGEYFALELINKGANVHSLCYFNNTVLHFALFRRFLRIAEIAIEKGVDLNAQNDAGCTALHMLLNAKNVKSDPEGVNNGVALMLYNGADVSICDYNDYRAFELAILCGEGIEESQESLFLYSFDNFTKDYHLPVEVFLELMMLAPEWFDQILDKVIVDIPHCSCLDPSLLFFVDSHVLETTINHLDHVVLKLLQTKEPIFNGRFFFNANTDNIIRNFDILLNSHLKDETLDLIYRIKIDYLVSKLSQDKVCPDLIFYLLTYGLQVQEYDLEIIYKTYGFCDLFKFLLFMDVKKNKSSKIDIIPKIIFDTNMDVKDFISQYYTHQSLAEMLCYFSQPELRNLCYWRSKELAERVTSLPNVPSLIELARNVARKFLLKKYKIKKIGDFFTLLKKLPITTTHERILTYETKLY